MEDFSLNFKVFIFIITCLVFSLRNERFVVTVQKFGPKGSYWIKPSKTLGFLVPFIPFVICIKFLLVKILLSTLLKSVNFIVSLFGHIFKYRITITFLFLTFEHERIFENYLSVNRSFMKISYLNNPFNNDFKNFNVFLTNFSSFSDFKVFSKAPFSDALRHVEATHLAFNESQLSGFSMMQVFTERRLQTDFHFRLNVNVTVTIVSYMNCTSRETILSNFLQQWIDLNIPNVIEDIYVEILLPKTSLITVGIVYKPPSQTNFLEIRNMTFEKIDVDKKEIYSLRFQNRHVS